MESPAPPVIADHRHGGLLALIYGGLHADAPIANLVTIATPVNYDGMGLFKQWSDKRWYDVDRIVDTLGNIPPEMMYRSFELLRPADRLVSYVRLWDNLWNDDYVKHYRLFNKWTSDQIPFPGECYRQTTKDLMWENKLMKGELEVGGRRVDQGVTFDRVERARRDTYVPAYGYGPGWWWVEPSVLVVEGNRDHHHHEEHHSGGYEHRPGAVSAPQHRHRT